MTQSTTTHSRGLFARYPESGHTWIMAILIGVAAAAAPAEWTPHDVYILNGDATPIAVPSQYQLVTEKWGRVVAVPYIVYMPERDRTLMLVSCDYPHQAMVLASDDRGATWSDPSFVHLSDDGKPDTGMGIGLTHLGGGKVMLTAGRRWFSADFGATWADYGAIPPLPDGKNWNGWDPMFVDRDPVSSAVTRIIETGYSMDTALWESNNGPGYSKGHLRVSTDEGRTWDAAAKVPEWDGASEITIIRAANGNLVAACRTDKPTDQKEVIDHFEGMAVSISIDNGKTWSPLNRLYAWGRHHPSLIAVPDGRLVMTYVVRKGYVDTADGYPQFGIEAIISRDNGETWDLDHRYVLDWWKGNRQGPNGWWASCQATSTVLLPDGSILTAFGTGFRSQPNEQNLPAPRDVGLVRWRLSDADLNPATVVTQAPLDSDDRECFDPAILSKR